MKLYLPHAQLSTFQCPFSCHVFQLSGLCTSFPDPILHGYLEPSAFIKIFFATAMLNLALKYGSLHLWKEEAFKPEQNSMNTIALTSQKKYLSFVQT